MSFDVAAEAYDSYMGRYSTQLSAQFADVARVHPGQRVLDVGCGPGALTSELVVRVGPAGVAAVDPSESFVTAARERHPGVDVRQAVAERLPFPDDAFDAALAQLVVHFMQEPGRRSGRDGPGDPSGRQRRRVRVGSRREPGSAAALLGCRAGARPGCRR